MHLPVTRVKVALDFTSCHRPKLPRTGGALLVLFSIIFILFSDLNETADFLISHAIKPSTAVTYNCGWKRFKEFCKRNDLTYLPASESTLVLFVSQLYNDGLKASSVKVYLAGVRHFHILKRYPSPLNGDQLSLALKGSSSLSGAPIRKKPIKYDMLVQLCHKAKFRHDHLMLQAAMSLAFFGCLRCGEFCLPDNNSFDPYTHLCYHDIEFLTKEKVLRLHLKKSKTDKINAGVDVFVGCTGEEVCAYCYMWDYISLRQQVTSTSPLFIDPSGSILQKTTFVNAVRLLLSMIGEKPSEYSGHSFRAGAATTADESNFQTHEIKKLGRWSSEAFHLYLRDPKIASKYAARMAKSQSTQ